MLKNYYNIKCDCCGKMLLDEPADTQSTLRAKLKEQDWKSTRDDRNYCDSCWTSDLDENIITKDHKTFRVDEEKDVLDEVTPGTRFHIGTLMRSIDVTVAYCPECGSMTEISWHPEDVITLPDGTTGVEAWCPNCDIDFFAKET